MNFLIPFAPIPNGSFPFPVPGLALFSFPLVIPIPSQSYSHSTTANTNKYVPTKRKNNNKQIIILNNNNGSISNTKFKSYPQLYIMKHLLTSKLICAFKNIVIENGKTGNFHSLPLPHSHSHETGVAIPIPMGIPNVDSSLVPVRELKWIVSSCTCSERELPLRKSGAGFLWAKCPSRNVESARTY